MSNPELVKSIKKKFIELFKEKPCLYSSPGRINLIGEHTDYNMGFVLPAAIDKAIYLAISPRKDLQCKIFAYDLNDYFECSLEKISKSEKHWQNYLLGVVDQIRKAGYKYSGFNCVFGGDIPIGAGLSSSAALEAGLAFALNKIFDLGIDNLSLVKMSQKAENEFVGVNCGIMDQHINIFGKEGKVLRLDCRNLEYEYFPFDFENISIVLFDTNISHSLASSEYNTRREECNTGVQIIKNDFPFVESLRDVSQDILSGYKSKMSPTIFKRCKYVIEENIRVLRACEALNKKDLRVFGELINESHEGLSNEYEVSCTELDFLAEVSKYNSKVYGSRMMGGGFGGCTINLIETKAVEKVSEEVQKQYKKKFGNEVKVYNTQIGNGTKQMEYEDETY